MSFKYFTHLSLEIVHGTVHHHSKLDWWSKVSTPRFAFSILPIKLYVLPSYTHNKINVFDVQGTQWIPIEKVWVYLNLRTKIPYSWYSQRRKNSMLHCFVGINDILFANCVFLLTNLVSKWSTRPRIYSIVKQQWGGRTRCCFMGQENIIF
jgi:hypothetical protein